GRLKADVAAVALVVGDAALLDGKVDHAAKNAVLGHDLAGVYELSAGDGRAEDVGLLRAQQRRQGGPEHGARSRGNDETEEFAAARIRRSETVGHGSSPF